MTLLSDINKQYISLIDLTIFIVSYNVHEIYKYKYIIFKTQYFLV